MKEEQTPEMIEPDALTLLCESESTSKALTLISDKLGVSGQESSSHRKSPNTPNAKSVMLLGEEECSVGKRTIHSMAVKR